MAVMAAVTCVANVITTALSAKISTGFAAGLRKEIFHKVQDLSAADMDRFGTASLVARSTSDVTNVQSFLTLLLRMGAMAPLMAVAGMVLSAATGGKVSSVLSVAIPVLLISAAVIILAAARYSVSMRKKMDRMNSLFLETLEGVRVIRAFNRQQTEMDRFREENQAYTKVMMKSGRSGSRRTCASEYILPDRTGTDDGCYRTYRLILVDGVDVRKWRLQDLRERIGYVPQKNVLFTGDIASNLNFGNESGQEADWKRAAEIACADEFIEKKADRFHEHISQGGTNLSGGQRQRLAIARAVMKKPEIYLFDDSFSALDMKTDKKLRENLKKEANGAAIIMVAQRISTILSADQILVIDGGEVIGKGTNYDLLQNCPAYREMALLQLGEDAVQKMLQEGEKQ